MLTLFSTPMNTPTLNTAHKPRQPYFWQSLASMYVKDWKQTKQAVPMMGFHAKMVLPPFPNICRF
jgi:hypothetical protein